MSYLEKVGRRILLGPLPHFQQTVRPRESGELAVDVYKPGNLIKVSGVYNVDHRQHGLMHEAALAEGERFPLCRAWRSTTSGLPFSAMCKVKRVPSPQPISWKNTEVSCC
jgi:hypothetical protein